MADPALSKSGETSVDLLALMSGEEMRHCRLSLGMTHGELASALRLAPQAESQITRWEEGTMPVPGPVALAIEYLLYMDTIGEPLPSSGLFSV